MLARFLEFTDDVQMTHQLAIGDEGRLRIWFREENAIAETRHVDFQSDLRLIFMM
ncbi:hypothetical protein O6H91_Y030300 [Diphasiastrum complanatum]|nr:hypothetical protein O6H91_Y030300 [Diphasiastrum complanatum]